MINIVVKLAATKTKPFNVDPTITVGDFEGIIAEEEGAKGVQLVYLSKILNKPNVVLSTLGVYDGCTMFAALEVFGGTGTTEGGCHEMHEAQVNKLKGNLLTIVTTDCHAGVSIGCKVPSIKKVKFSCGCITCPDCMRAVIKMLTDHHFQITCGSKHKGFVVVPMQLALAIGGYSGAEAEEMKVNITEKWMNAACSSIKTCPNPKCVRYIFRGDNLGEVNRVRCPTCKAYDFCWFCRKKWTGSGAKFCGDTNCSARSAFEVLLNAAPEINIGVIHNIPSMRVCVNMECCAMNRHVGECKHMTCKSCTKMYCQSCLKIWDAKGKLGNAGCNHKKTCVPLPVQDITDKMFVKMKLNG